MAEEEKQGTAATAEEEDTRLVALVSQEGDSFNVSLNVAQMSELVKTMIDGELPAYRGAPSPRNAGAPRLCCAAPPRPALHCSTPSRAPRHVLPRPISRVAPPRDERRSSQRGYFRTSALLPRFFCSLSAPTRPRPLQTSRTTRTKPRRSRSRT